MDACQVTIAAADRAEAWRISEILLDRRLAACVQLVGPIESRYWWQGVREAGKEWLCLAKSRLSLVDEVVAAVRSVHSYEVPEVIAVPIVAGDPEYLAWLEAEASGSGDPQL